MHHNNIVKIAKKILASKKITVRKLLSLNINLQITSGIDDTFIAYFNGPVQLTNDGNIRWTSNGVFDIQLLIDGNHGSIINVLSDEQLKNFCALFNTINGNVNKYTYKKYVKNKGK